VTGGPLITPQRLAIAVVCAVSLVGCCALAWWQWTRFESASGTFQNLGYVLQWPLFGLFPAFMVWRIRRLDAQRKAEPPAAAPAPVVTVDAVREPVVDSDDELAVYNRYLAELNARDQR
jgi:hypothetical protein